MALARRTSALAAAGLALMILGCERKPQSEPSGEKGGLTVTSTAFRNGEPIPAKYTGDGEDVSPQLAWTGAPPGTRSFVIICDDPDAPGGVFVHWVVYDLPPETTSLPEGVPRESTPPGGGAQGTNDFGRRGYIGPSPPAGPAHHYHFRVYALSKTLGLKPGARRSAVDKAMKGAVLASGELVGTYQR